MEPHATAPPVLTAAAMREADRITIADVGIPSFALMESAARAAAARLLSRYDPVAGKRFTCLCGRGNNGGDGFVVARVLHAHGAHVRVVSLSTPEAMTEDAAHNWKLLEAIAPHDDRLTLHRFESLTQLGAFRTPDVYVDALLGTGLTSELREPIRSIVDWLNDQPQPTVALDTPTGLHTDTGSVLGAAVRADNTITMAALKTGLLLGDGPAHTGDVEVVEIGIPRFVIDRVLGAFDGCARLTSDAVVRSWLPTRTHDAHKYNVGLALVVGGSQGMAGAPVMAALAATRSGAGYVQCAAPKALLPTLANKLTTITALPLPGTNAGGIDPEASMEALRDRLAKARALLVGPGLGTHPQTHAFVRTLLQQTDVPVVIDADGLNALAQAPGFLEAHAQGRWILTPHAGEFKRLAGDDVDLSDRIRTAQAFARKWNSVLLLKGLPSVVAAPDGTAYLCATGNPALATAGTGDVLAGTCAGLQAQGLAPLRAAAAARHIGGAAADRYAQHAHPHAMTATDLIEQLPLVLHERFRS